MSGMMTEPEPTINEEDIRKCLLGRAQAYAASNNVSFSAIGIAAVGDSKFLHRVREGLGFNIKTYQRMMDWLESVNTGSGATE